MRLVLISFITLTLFSFSFTELLAFEQLYSCITSEGTKFFTDDPALLPHLCSQNPKNVRTVDSVNIVSLSQTPEAISTQDLLSERENEKKHQEQVLKRLTTEAEKLVAQYDTAKRNLKRSFQAKKDRSFRREIRQIKIQRDEMLKELASARTSFKEKEIVENLLKDIPPE